MGTPSCLMRPRPAPFANFGLPTLHAGEGLGAKLAPPLVAGTKGTLLLRPFPLFLLAVKKSITAAYIWASVEGSGALPFPIQPHAPYRSAPPRVLYPEGPELVQGGCGPHFGLCASTACPYMLRPAPLRSKGLSHLSAKGSRGQHTPPSMKAVQGF